MGAGEDTSPAFFETAVAFREWLQDHHADEAELLVGFWKVASGRASMSWSESVDVALCFGWIDGVRRRIDDESYSIRFTPRRPGSIWSAVNVDKAQSLDRRWTHDRGRNGRVRGSQVRSDSHLLPRTAGGVTHCHRASGVGGRTGGGRVLRRAGPVVPACCRALAARCQAGQDAAAALVVAGGG